MKLTPAIFTTPNVLSIRDGAKTQTRRLVKWKPYSGYTGNFNHAACHVGYVCTGVPASGHCLYSKSGACWNQRTTATFCPYGQAGDRLWVRESFFIEQWRRTSTRLIELNGHWLAGGRFSIVLTADESKKFGQWKRKKGTQPAIFCFQSLSRINMRITEIRVERVRDIVAADCVKEGLVHGGRGMWSCPGTNAIFDEGYKAYRWLWNSINTKPGQRWEDDPWVWVITFKRGL